MTKLSEVVDKIFTENPHIVKDAKKIDATFSYLIRLIIQTTRNRVTYHDVCRLVQEKLRRVTE